ncbi:protease [gut metagenome]|uniref:Protease n=1 Tax=gut metagenome TaxID=749906 RepID=J9BUW6_9ZZZZ
MAMGFFVFQLQCSDKKFVTFWKPSAYHRIFFSNFAHIMKRKIELLAPARDVECGLEAIRHGADAVYIGGPSFGARSAAGNTVEDIARLCLFAHTYQAKVYVTLNTILYDNELEAAEKLVWQLYQSGVDALIVQDLALLRLNLPPIALHASTQMDNRTPEKAAWLEKAGFSQIVLARELNLEEISAIHKTVKVPLEVFVHGALCVSYSGQCYASQYCFGRSANRGSCAQFCRLSFDLINADGEPIVKDKHLLSLRDMNRSGSLEEMMDAGVSSFKIEGRLKDVTYVKNITAYYRRAIDRVLERRSDDYERSSAGNVHLQFEPRAEKSFNRGFTEYYLHGRTEGVHSFETPKAMGEIIGRAKRIGRKSFSIKYEQGEDEAQRLHAGDGVCFLTADGKLQGFRVNKVEGMDVYPAVMPPLVPNTVLYRNLDFEFDKQLSRPTAERRLQLDLALEECPEGYCLCLKDETGAEVSVPFACEHVEAQRPQYENIVRQLSKMGDTPFEVRQVEVRTEGERFIPSSQLSAWRREAVDQLMEKKLTHYQRDFRQPEQQGLQTAAQLSYLSNVANGEARAFYASIGAKEIAPAYEISQPDRAVLMFCRHCLRYTFGLCPQRHHRPFPKEWKEPLSLQLSDGRRFELEFDCKNCQMKVYAP